MQAATTKSYADATCEVGKVLDVAVLNLWQVFMSETDWNVDTWKKEDPIPGSMYLPENDTLANLLTDGMTSLSVLTPRC